MAHDPYGELAEMLTDLIHHVDDLARDPATAYVDRFGGSEKLDENLNEELQEVGRVVAGLLDRARDCPEDEWAARRAELITELDHSFEALRESYGILREALDQREIPLLVRVSEDLRSAESHLYWLRRRSHNDRGRSEA